MRDDDIKGMISLINAYLAREGISQNELSRRAGQPLWWTAWLIREAGSRDALQIMPGIDRLDAIHRVITGKSLLAVAPALPEPSRTAQNGPERPDAAPPARAGRKTRAERKKQRIEQAIETATAVAAVSGFRAADDDDDDDDDTGGKRRKSGSSGTAAGRALLSAFSSSDD